MSVLDEGEERNFVAVGVHISGNQIHIDVGGVEHHFRLSDLVDILSVEHFRVQAVEGRMPALCH